MDRIARAALAAVSVAALAAGPAVGLESLTGVYQGKLKCTGLLSGQKVKTKIDIEVDVSDTGGSLLLSIGEFGSFEGYAVTDVKKPEHGAAVAVSCPLSVATLDGAMLNADVKIKAGTPKGSLHGTVFLSGDSQGDARSCDLKVDRVSPVSPKILGCM